MATVPISGTSDPRFEVLEAVFRHHLENGLDDGASLAASVHGEIVVDLWGGYADPEKRVPWERDTLVCVFSTSKIMVILSILMLWERGLLDIDSPVATYWPEFAQNGKDGITVRQVMTHRSGLPGVGAPINPALLAVPNRVQRLLEEAEPWYEPGSVTCYHAFTFGFILAEVVTRVSGVPFARLFADQIASPLGADFHFGITDPATVARVARLRFDDFSFNFPSPLATRVMDEIDMACFGPDAIATVIPAGNGHGNARSLVQVGSVFAMGGRAGDRSYVGRDKLDEATAEQVYAHDPIMGWCRYGLGFGLHSPGFPAPTPTTFHWGGYGGSFLTMDMASGLACAYTPNYLREQASFEESGTPASVDQRFLEKWMALAHAAAGVAS